MANQTIKQLTALTEQTIDKTNDLIAVWDEDTVTPANSITKKVSVGNIITSPNSGVDVGGGNTNGRVNRIVSISQAQYDLVNPKDSETLYVITDGVTLDSYNGQIDTPAASKNYYLDLQAVSDRTIVKFQILYTSGASGAGTITLKVNGGGTPGTNEDTITFAASQTNQAAGGGAISLAATAGQEIRLETNASVADVTNLAFIVEYEV